MNLPALFGRLRQYVTSPDGRARLLLLLTSLVAFPELLTFSRVLVADDGFTSDAFNGELAGRVLLGRMLAEGQNIQWTTELGAGYPLASGMVGDPFGALYFTLLPPAVALCAFLLTFIWLAAQGTYGFSRYLGATRWGAVFAATAFASGGYLVSQLRHLSIVATVAWLPLQLLLLDQALSGPAPGAPGSSDALRYRLKRLLLLGGIVAVQANAGFPQSTYICLLAAVIYAVPLWAWRSWRTRRWKEAGALAVFAVWVVAAAILTSSLTLLSLVELAEQSGRNPELMSAWVKSLGFPPSYLLNVFSPDLHGNAADNTYSGSLPYWEAYLYSGIATALLGLSFVFTGFRHPRYLSLGTIAAFSALLVLGFETPIFPFLWDYLPGLSSFRFPTRFLVVFLLALSVFAGLQLSALERLVDRRIRLRHRFLGPHSLGWVAGLALTSILLVDLALSQRKQNPLEPAAEWLSPPSSVTFLRAQENVRIHSLHDRYHHRRSFERAHGWQFPAVYRRLVPSLAPNLPAFFGVPSLDVYSGAAPATWAELWSDHGHPAPILRLLAVSETSLLVDARYFETLRLFGVSHMLSPIPVRGAGENALVHSGSHTYVYEVGGHRARCVRGGRMVRDTRDALVHLFSRDFEPDETVLIHPDPRFSRELPVGRHQGTTPLRVVDVDTRRIAIDVSACDGGYVFVGDTWYPGWTAFVDGQERPIFRANVAGRAVAVPPGAKQLTMRFEMESWNRGFWLSLAGALLLLLTAIGVIRIRH